MIKSLVISGNERQEFIENRVLYYENQSSEDDSMFDSDWSLKISRAPRKLKNRLKIRSHIFNKVLRNLTKSKIK